MMSRLSKSSRVDYFVCLVARLIARILFLLPFPVSTWLACRAGDAIYFLVPSRRRIVFENLERAFGTSLTPRRKAEIARRSFRNMAVSAVELFLIPKMLPEASARITLRNPSVLEEAFRQGKGVILVIAHLGSWEYLSFLPFLTGQRWSVIVKGIKNPYLDRDVTDLRCQMKVNPVPKKDKNAVKLIMKELKQNHGAAILIDQWAGPDGVWVDFFGAPTSTTSVPARLAQRVGTPMVPAYCIRKGPGHYEIQIDDPVPAAGCGELEITQRLNGLLERKIREYPEQWLWMHRRWKPKPGIMREIKVSDQNGTATLPREDRIENQPDQSEV